MDGEELWRNPDLTLEVLAAQLGSNRTSLAQVIRQHGYSGYKEFINRRRIEEFLRIARDEKRLNVQDAFFRVGFRSKTACVISAATTRCSPRSGCKTAAKTNDPRRFVVLKRGQRVRSDCDYVGVRASDLDVYRENSQFLQKVDTFREAEAEQLEEAIRTACFIFIYFDATHATDEERANFIEHFRSLWLHALRDKKELVLFALCIGDYAPISERLIGFDVVAGLYFFSGRLNSVVYVDMADTPAAVQGMEVMKDYIFRDFSKSRADVSGEDLPKECVKTVYRSLQFHYERPSTLEWDSKGIEGVADSKGIAGIFHEGLPASAEVESRSAVVDVDLEFEVYSAVGCEERWISCTAQGAGYKTNLLTRTGYRGDKKGMVLFKTCIRAMPTLPTCCGNTPFR